MRLININPYFIINNDDSSGTLEIDISNNNNISNIINNKNNSIVNLNTFVDCSINILNLHNSINIIKKNSLLDLYVTRNFSNNITCDPSSTIIFNLDNDYTYSGKINNSISMIKQGVGNLIINNDNLNDNIINVKKGIITINSNFSNTKIILEDKSLIKGTGNIKEGIMYASFKDIGMIPNICSYYGYINDTSLTITELNIFKIILGICIAIVLIYKIILLLYNIF